jgi:uncharacterized protein
MKALDSVLRANAPMLVAYSGGVDSTCLLVAAHRVLGDRMLGVIADSPSLPRAALAGALAVASERGIPVRVIATNEFADARYVENPPNRCYFCKAELFARMEEVAEAEGFAALAYGENADDPAHLRPGSVAAREFAVLAPLRLAGMTKADVRAMSRAWGLPTADAPAQPCLSSRIPHGTPVTREALAMVEAAEAVLHAGGFDVVRVRFVAGQPPTARIQVAPERVGELMDRRGDWERALGAVGFGGVVVDPDGYRSVVG